MRRWPALAVAVCASSFAACNEEPASATVLLDLAAFQGAALSGVSAPRATLDVFDEDGKPAIVSVVLPDEQRRVTSPVPMICDDGACRLSMELDPGRYAMRLRVTAEDRCGTEAQLLELLPLVDTIDLSPHETLDVPFDVSDASFDDDLDGIANVLEPLVCGRFDVVDRDRPATMCLTDRDACCARGASPLQGRMAVFAGGDHALADGTTIPVAPFALDATEATVAAFERCVAAGACLAGDRDHAARATLDSDAVDRSLPQTGLTPKEAAEVCAFMGKRLPTDDEWDFAAAHRDDGARGRYPWDDDALDLVIDAQDVGHGALPNAAAIGCRPDDAPAANHAAHGADCPDAKVAVGAYASTFVRRGRGAAVADLAGNVAEWTVVEGTDGATHDVLPAADVAAVVLRGGGAASFVELLENDFVVKVKRPEAGADGAAFVATIRRLSAEAGFRCAVTMDDVDAEPPGADEPTCEAAE